MTGPHEFNRNKFGTTLEQPTVTYLILSFASSFEKGHSSVITHKAVLRGFVFLFEK